MRYIELTQGLKSTVSDEDYEYLIQWKWYAHKSRGRWYAARTRPLRKLLLGSKTIYMHRAIMERMGYTQEEMHLVDHKNTRDSLDNRRENLRPSDYSKNAMNSDAPITSTSGYKGVSWSNKRKEWVAQIIYHDRPFQIGSSESIEFAARLRDYAEYKLFGEHSNLRFPDNMLPADRILDARIDLIKQGKPIPQLIGNMKRNKSGYFGVCWNKKNNKWVAQIAHNKLKIHIGYYTDIIEAARAFDIKAIELRGLLATTNFPIEEYINS